MYGFRFDRVPISIVSIKNTKKPTALMAPSKEASGIKEIECGKIEAGIRSGSDSTSAGKKSAKGSAWNSA